MSKWSLLAAIILSGCGGGSGGGDSNPVTPTDNTGTPGNNTGNGTGEGDGVTCKSLDCMGSDFTRSVLDPQKFVKRCAEGLQMVDDICAEPRVVVTAGSEIEFGNSASSTSLFKTNINGEAATVAYLKLKELPPSDYSLRGEYEYKIEGDQEASDRWNIPGITLADRRFESSNMELFFGVPGFDSNPIALSASIFGENFSGTHSYSETRIFCSAVIAKFALIKQGLNIISTALPDTFDGRERQNCSFAAYPGSEIEKITLYSVCRDEDRCLLKSVSVWRASQG